MAWPKRPDNWRQGGKPAQAAFADVARAISAVTPVSMAVSAGKYAEARAALPPEIRLVEMPTDDCWMRDTGPTFVTNGQGLRRGVQWDFNAWGGTVDGLYSSWAQDDEMERGEWESRPGGEA